MARRTDLVLRVVFLVLPGLLKSWSICENPLGFMAQSYERLRSLKVWYPIDLPGAVFGDIKTA